ncbi:MAG: NAD(P)H-dependent oxidoreductase [Bacteroidota bacterium]
MKRIIIQGSSRSDGNTSKVVALLRQQLEFDLIDLNEKNIGHFDYDFNNRDDDFMPIFRDIANNYDLIVFATPVYWYTMSGLMKVFFDRISDGLIVDKPTGRKLRGKSMASISCGSDDHLPEGYEVPFRESAGYLGMHWLGHLHTWVEDGKAPEELVVERVTKFVKKIT